MKRPQPKSRFRRVLPAVLAVLVGVALGACSDDDVDDRFNSNDDTNASECEAGEEWNPVAEQCEPADDPDAGPNGSLDSDNPSQDSGDSGGSGGDEDTGPSCENLECDQVTCSGPQSTTITGTVTIPSGELPLPDVAVYVPNTPVEPPTEGASCEPCEDALSADPVVGTETNIHGHFTLTNAPAGEEIPLVVEVGKWRRQQTIEVQECQNNPIDEDKTRLPRNQDEGDMPRMAVSTGGWDALECLIKKIGVDRREFTPEEDHPDFDPDEDEVGAVNLFAGHGGSDRYSDSLNDGASFTTAWDWWDDLDNLLDYDIILHSCEGSANLGDKSSEARDALYDFTLAGGRVFLSHWHNAWLEHGPAPFQSVANWDSGMTSLNDPETGFIDTSFHKGDMLYNWMDHYSSAPTGQFPIHEPRATVGTVNEDRAQQWVWAEPDDPPFNDPFFPDPPDEVVQYFTFNTPLEAEPQDQCGRVVFSDIHVSPDDNSSPDNPFPDDSCSGGDLTPQEKALVFMLFDLSRCITPDKKKGVPQ